MRVIKKQSKTELVKKKVIFKGGTIYKYLYYK